MVRPHVGQQRLAELARLPGARIIVAVLGRRWGKTLGAMQLVIDEMLRAPGPYGWGGHEWRTVDDVWTRFLRRIPAGAVKRRRDSTHDLELVNGSTLSMYSLNNPDSVVGRGFRLFVLDEGARVSGEVRDSNVGPALMDWPDSRLLVTTTPRGRTGRGAWVFRDYQRAAEKVPGYYKLHGPSWENPLAAVREWTEFCRANLPAAVFEQEIEAKFLEGGLGVLDLASICTLGGSREQPVKLPWSSGPEPAEPCVAGVDLAQREDWTVVAVLGLRTRRLRALDRFSRLPWEAQVERVARTCRAWGATAHYDATGIGGPVGEQLARALGRRDGPGKPVRCVPVVFTSDVKQELIQGLQVAAERREISMPWIAEAISEAETLEAEVLTSGRIRYGAAEGFHDDVIIALALAERATRYVVSGDIR